MLRYAQHDGHIKGWSAAGTGLALLAAALAVTASLGGEETPEIAEGTRALYRGDYEQARTLASKYLVSRCHRIEGRHYARSRHAAGLYAAGARLPEAGSDARSAAGSPERAATGARRGQDARGDARLRSPMIAD